VAVVFLSSGRESAVPALEKLNIDTPEQVALEFSLATVGSRFLALAVDTLIQIGCGLVLLTGVALGGWAASFTLAQAGQWFLALAVLGLFVIYYGYFAVFESVWNGQTPGKRVIGLRVIHVSGRPVSVFEALLRNIIRIADQLPGIYAIGIVSVFVTERSQRLGDLAAGTVVVHEMGGRADSREFRADVSATVQGIPSTQHGALKLTAEEIAVVELFLRRREQLEVFGRERAARKIAERMRDRLGITERVEDERLLEEIVEEYKSKGRYR
jgi:uncharacterized RDD family membrane protein YckC